MIGPFIALKNGKIGFVGNNIFPATSNLSKYLDLRYLNKNNYIVDDEKFWDGITKINDVIVKSAFCYFAKRNTSFINLPLTTRMISSPGAVYGKGKINYTTDTCPITLHWFDLPDLAFLSESSQIYLELALSQRKINEVFSIYNSFRKEKADFCHLSEFHHLEFEAKILQNNNIEIIKSLVIAILVDLLEQCIEELDYFINKENIRFLEKIIEGSGFEEISFTEVLELLYQETQDNKYKVFTLSDNFGAWEEIKLTNYFNKNLIIREFPLLEVPFYHAIVKDSFPEKANNADIIWAGYREFIGSGQRISDLKELSEKAQIFNLPLKDYSPYIDSRKSQFYKTTSGFGMGLERLVQGVLCLPNIQLTNLFPRTHLSLYP